MEAKIAQLEAGGRALPRKRVCIRMDQRLKEMKTRLENGAYSLTEYVSAIGHFTGLLILNDVNFTVTACI